LFRLTNGKILPAVYPNQFDAIRVSQVYEDRSGLLWVSGNRGLFHLRDTPFLGLGEKQGLNLTGVNSVYEAQNGDWWIGTYGGGIFRWDGKQAHRVDKIVFPETIYTLGEDKAGAIWIGTSGGLFRYADGEVKDYFLGKDAPEWRKKLAADPNIALPGIAHTRVNNIISDGSGGIWAATHGGALS